MKKITTLLLTFMVLFTAGSGIFLSAQNTAEQGQEAFINFLVKNKEMLGYESFGTFEHEDRTEVRIYCSDDARMKIEENLPVFDTKEFKYMGSDNGTGTLFVVFSKGGGTVGTTPAVKKPETQKKCPKKVSVEFVQLAKKPFNEYKYLEKGLTDGGVSTLYSTTSGEVAKVFLNAGDKVETGDIILNFDVSGLDAKISETGTLLSDWRTNLRKRTQWKVRSARAELQAENKVKEYEAELEKLNALREKNVLVAEKTGQIISIVASGTTLAENDEVAKILDNSVMKMVVTGDDAALLNGLDTLTAKFGSLNEVRTGTVGRDGGKVVVSFKNDDLRLTSKSVGMFKVLLQSFDAALVIDKNLVRKDAAGEYVFVIQKKKARKAYVQTGPTENGEVVILSGLNEGVELITTIDDCIRDGKKVVFTPPAPEKKAVKKAEKKVEPAEKQVQKVVRKEMEPVEVNEVKYMVKKNLSEFDNCPSKLKVYTRIVKRGGFTGWETFTSAIASSSVDTVSSEIDGLVGEVHAANGSEVTRGQLLMTLDIEDMKTRLENSRSSLDEWKKLLAEIEGWTERSENLEDELKEKIRKISLLIPKLNSMITNANIYSPVGGVVSYIARSGDAVKEKGTLAKIESPSQVLIPVIVENVADYNENMDVEVAIEGVAGTFKGRLQTADGLLFAVVDNFSKALSAGMNAKVNILRDYRDVIVVNKSEILRDDDGYYGFIVNMARAKQVKLTAGAEKGSRIMILAGLNEGDELIISEFDCLRDGKKIKIKYFDPEKGKYVIKKTADEEIDIAGRLFAKKMGAGLGVGMYMVSDEVFTTVYGSGVISGVFDLSYNVFNKVELFLNTWYIPKTGSSESIDKVNLSMFSFYIGAKYMINWTGKFLPYVGVALNSLAVKEKSDELALDTSYRTSVGFSGIGGFYYKLKENMNIKFDIRYDVNKMKIEEFESELDFSGIKFALGIVFRF